MPVSASPLLTTTLPVGTPKRCSSMATPSLDDKVEYMDGFGVPRRSETYTRRMLLRGHEIKMPTDLINGKGDNGENDVVGEHTIRREQQEQSEEVLVHEAKRKANAAFKHQCKTERQQWIDAADQRLVDRLTVWYDGTAVPADADFVAVTEQHTEGSPSKKAMSFIDADGNVRRKSAPLVAMKSDDTDSSQASTLEIVTELRPVATVLPPIAQTTGEVSS